MNNFYPDLIVEVTGACNRACPGCYAPNLVTNKTPKQIFEENPGLFLTLSKLNDGFNQMPAYPYITAIRGGEPTLHPDLPSLLLISHRKSRIVMLETHGRWLLPENIADHANLIKAIKQYDITVKISFDQMHGLSVEKLKKITDTLEDQGIQYRIAITEKDILQGFETRKLCHWVKDQDIIFQWKAETAKELVEPSLGVINIKGEFKMSVTSKFKAYEVAL